MRGLLRLVAGFGVLLAFATTTPVRASAGSGRAAPLAVPAGVIHQLVTAGVHRGLPLVGCSEHGQTTSKRKPLHGRSRKSTEPQHAPLLPEDSARVQLLPVVDPPSLGTRIAYDVQPSSDLPPRAPPVTTAS